MFSIQAYAKPPLNIIKNVEDTIRTYEMCLGKIRGFNQALSLTLGKSLRNSPKYKEWEKKNDLKRQVVWPLKNKMYKTDFNLSFQTLDQATTELKKITCTYSNQLKRQVLSEFPDLMKRVNKMKMESRDRRRSGDSRRTIQGEALQMFL